jgi:hypothetical protein
MEHRIAASSALDRALGSFGLALIVLLGWAYEQRTIESRTGAARLRRALASVVIESITLIGTAGDCIAPLPARHAPGAFAARLSGRTR